AAGASVVLLITPSDSAVAYDALEADLDASGRARFESLRPGSYVLRLAEPGLLPVTARGEIIEGGEVFAAPTEPQGGEVDVVVVDADGRGLPFAIFAVTTPSRLPWLDVDGSVQRVDAFTDSLGRRRMAHVEP